jgi:TPR repeat protein
MSRNGWVVRPEPTPGAIWWRVAGWTCLGGLGVCGLLVAGLVAAAAVVLTPFALIGFLIGPASDLPLARLALPVLAWLLGVVLSGAVIYWSAQGLRALMHRSASAPDGHRPIHLTAWLSGAAASLALCMAALGILSSALGWNSPPAAPRPATAAERAEFEERWRPQAEAGDPQAQTAVGLVLMGGALGQPVDRRAAKSWLEKAAAQGDPDARLSLLVARGLGSFGTPQDFQIAVPLGEFALEQTGWRRGAVALMLANHPPVTVGQGPDPVAQAAWARRWLEVAARAGSPRAAFELARRLEQRRSAQGVPDPDAIGALRWYAVAGASDEVARLQAATGLVVPLQDLPVIETPSASPSLIEQFQRRARWAAAGHDAGSTVNLATLDAQMHAVVAGEAGRRYLALADEIMNPPPERGRGDEALAAMYYQRAAREGDPQAKARLEAMGRSTR